MICPICGSDCKDARVCPNCEWDLRDTDEQPKIHIPEPPIGRYEGIDGYIELWYCTMTIHKEINGQILERKIAYDEVASVVFRQASDSENGYCSIREKKDFLPPVTREQDAVYDETTLTFGTENNNSFYGIYAYLKQVACPLEPSNIKKGRKSLFVTYSAKVSVCPKCGSSKCGIHEKERSAVRPYKSARLYPYQNVFLKLIAFLIHIHFWVPRKTKNVCLYCGHKWMR